MAMTALEKKAAGIGSVRRALVQQEWLPGRFALRDTWFPIAHAPHVGVRPIRRLIHSQPYFLWREGDRVIAAEFHPLEQAKRRIQGGELSGGSGIYPSLERYGYVWVWYGNPDNAQEALLPDVPYLSRSGPKLPRNMWGQIYFNAAYELCSENLLDQIGRAHV